MIAPIPTPFHLFDKTCTVKSPRTGQDATGAWRSALGEVEYAGTWLCNVQPTSSVEGLQFQMNTGNKTYDVFFPRTNTDGDNLTENCVTKLAILTFDGRRLEVQGQVRNLIENGCVWTCIASEMTE